MRTPTNVRYEIWSQPHIFISELNHNHTIYILKFSFIHPFYPLSSLTTSKLHTILLLLPSLPMAQPLSSPLMLWAWPYTHNNRSHLPVLCCCRWCRGGVVNAGDIVTLPHNLDIQKLILLSSPPCLLVTLGLPSALPRSHQRESIDGAFRRLSNLHLVITINQFPTPQALSCSRLFIFVHGDFIL